MRNRVRRRGALRELVSIRPGYPFRGKLALDDYGDAFVVQFRHVAVGKRLDDEFGKSFDRAALSGRKQPDYLRSGDVLFMAKGSRNHAVVIGDVPENTVCTPNFYHIRLKPNVDDLLPEFLAWQINHRYAQRYFSICSQGSVAPSITKVQLGELPIAIPPLEEQKQMVNLADAATREHELLSQLIANRQRMIDAVGSHLLRPDPTKGN